MQAEADPAGLRDRGPRPRRASPPARAPPPTRKTPRRPTRACAPNSRAVELDADDRVVARVLLRVDRVVADRPAERRRVERDRGPRQRAERGRPAHQRAPGEREAEHRLRPGGDALHQRIDRDDDQRGEAERDRKPVEAQQHREPDQRLRDQERGGGSHAGAAGGQRAAAGALDAGVELAVEDVVVGAAGAAHRDRADQEQREMPEVRAAVRGKAGERGRLPAGRKQQLPADRPIPARQLHEGQRRSPASAASTRLAGLASGSSAEAAPRRSKRAGGQRLRLRRGRRLARACSFIFFDLRGDGAGLVGEADALGVSGLELRRWRRRGPDTSPCSSPYRRASRSSAEIERRGLRAEHGRVELLAVRGRDQRR